MCGSPSHLVEGLAGKLAPLHPVGTAAAALSDQWPASTGVRGAANVAVGVIDSHVALPAVGDPRAGVLVHALGASAAYLLLALTGARLFPFPPTGETKGRPAQIRTFQNGETSVFLISLKAGGVGLNLTAADTVILYDPWWNPAVEAQAINRAHRIGQDKPVFVHKLMASGTIEEKMETLKDTKRALADSLFDADGAPTLAMTEDDIEALFAAE